MIEVLAAIGFIILYFTWLFIPFIMFKHFIEGEDILGRLVIIPYVSGALFVGYALVNFIGIW